MRFGSLFSGIGGLDLGLERAGMKCAWQVEKDEWCSRVLSRHWPTVPRWGDIEDFLADAESIHGKRSLPGGDSGWQSEGEIRNGGCGRVDLICGGFPCQPVSLAGKRQGKDDARWLWPQFARAVGLLRPRYVLAENVPGLLTNGGVGVIESLTELGYYSEWDLVSAASVGAPHLRKRIFIVAYTDETELRIQPAGQSWSSGAPVARDNGKQGAVAYAEGARQLRAEQLEDDSEGERNRRSPNDFDSKGEIRGQSKAGDVAYADTSGRHGWSRVFGQGWWTELAISSQWTTEPDVGRVANGVPKRVDRLRGLGNAVVPQVAEYVGCRIVELDGK